MSRAARQSILSVLAVLGLWELLGAAGWLDLRFFPRPSAISSRLAELIANPETGFAGDLLYSLARLGLGALVALPAAVALAALAEVSPFWRAVFRPWVAITYPVPKLAVFPLLLVIFGIGEGSKVALVALGIFHLVYLSTAQGVRRVLESEYYDVALVYRIPRARRFLQVLLRGALPELLNGVKTGLGYGLVMVIAAEFTASRRGLGVFIWSAWDRFQILDLYGGLAALSFAGWAIFYGTGALERRYGRYD